MFDLLFPMSFTRNQRAADERRHDPGYG